MEQHSPAAAPFDAAQIASFQAEDVHAATAIIVLMMSIFTFGLVGYSIVAWWVS